MLCFPPISLSSARRKAGERDCPLMETGTPATMPISRYLNVLSSMLVYYRHDTYVQMKSLCFMFIKKGSYPYFS
jgi:hypothetical protein